LLSEKDRTKPGKILNKKYPFMNMESLRYTVNYTWTDYKTNAQIVKELKITPILDKLMECKRSWIQHVQGW